MLTMESFISSLGEANSPEPSPEQNFNNVSNSTFEGTVCTMTPEVVVDIVPDVPVALVTGHPDYWVEHLDTQQGDNPFDAQGNCGLVSVANVLTMSGNETTETEMTQYALANGLCRVSLFDPEGRGGTSEYEISQLLEEHGLANYIVSARNMSYEDMATLIENGHGMVGLVNVYLTEPGYEQYATPDAYGQYYADHAVCMTGTVRDAGTGEVCGFYVCDSGVGNGMKYISVETMDIAYKNLPNAGFIVTRDAIREM